MKASSFIIFISVVLAVYSAINYYIFIRGWQSLPNIKPVKIVYIILFAFIFLSYILARTLEKYDTTGITDILNIIGSYWMAAMLYFLIAVLMFDAIRLLNHFFHFLPAGLLADWNHVKLYTLAGTVLIVAFVVIAGYINASNPVIKSLGITINKDGGKYRNLKIAMASDLQLGHIINRERVQEFVEQVNKLNADIILIPGDILDEDVLLVESRKIGEPLKELKSKLGVWAVTGNHEYIGGAEKGVKYLRTLGINFLRDENVLIDSSFYLAGREDRDKGRFSGVNRKELKQIVGSIDFAKPVLLLDHQPYHLEQASNSGIDLQLSGHTHHGQLFPLNYITNKVYEQSWGYTKKSDTHYYISCGYGTWGPPIRTGNRPEIIIINIKFK